MNTLINKRRWSILRFFIIGWTAAFVFLSIVRGVGTEELGEIKFGFLDSILIALSLGPIMGCLSGIAQIVFEERFYRYVSLKRLMVMQLIYTFVFLILISIVAYGIYQLYFGTEMGLWAFMQDRGSVAIFFFVICTDFALSLLRQISLMLGEGNLSKLIRGRFYTPHEEHRIFMFLDLQASTSLAERLGHIQYSKLIQDCFNDMGIVVENRAEIYQYVGDEAVLTWPLREGLANNNCLNAFYSFKKQLEKNSDRYQKRYGCQPFFKAGLHSGVVTVTEVGKYKKEIAYHGDAINTAARIQGQCNTFEKDLLVSEALKTLLNSTDFSYEVLERIPLKGKKKTVTICAVNKAN